MEYPKLPINGSVDLSGKDFNIADDHVRLTQNLIPNKMGNPVRRGAMAYENMLISAVLADLPQSYPNFHLTTPSGGVSVQTQPIWLGIPNLDGGKFMFATCSGGTRFDLIVNNGSKKAQNSSVLNLKDTAPTQLPNVFFDKGLTYIVFGQSPWPSGGIILTPDTVNINGFVPSDLVFKGAANGGFQPDYAVKHQDRVVYATQDGTVIWADRYDPLTIGDAAQNVRALSTAWIDSGKLIALRSVMLQAEGSPSSTALLLLFEYGSKIILGEPLNTTETGSIFGTLQINTIGSKSGCISAATIVDTDWGTIWCGQDDVWMLPFNSVPVKIGRALRPLLLSQPPSQRFRCHAVFSGGFYRLALFSDGQGPNWETPLGEQWWLDLRDGFPQDWATARWFGPQVFTPASQLNTGNRSVNPTLVTGTAFMATDPRERNKIFGVHYGIGMDGTGFSQPTNANLVSYDALNARDLGGLNAMSLNPWTSGGAHAIGDELVVLPTANKHPLIFTAITGGNSGTTQPVWDNTGIPFTDGDITWNLVGAALGPYDVWGSEILTGWKSKEYDFGTRMVPKMFNGMEVNVRLSAPERLRFTQLVDAGKNQTQVDIDLDTRSAGPLLGSDIFVHPSGPFTEEYQSISARPLNGTRINGNSCQHTIQEISGISIPTLITTFGVVDGKGDLFTIPLSTNFFASIGALFDSIVASLVAYAAVNATFATELTDKWGTAYNFGFPYVQNQSGKSWAPSIAVEGDRFIWGILGYTNTPNYNPGAYQYSQEMPFDVLIGLDYGLAEATAAYHPFGRRPK